MKSFAIISSFIAIATSISSAAAFVNPHTAPPPMRAKPLQSTAKLDMTPELEAAVADVREAAAAFGEKTAHFANGTSLVRFFLAP